MKHDSIKLAQGDCGAGAAANQDVHVDGGAKATAGTPASAEYPRDRLIALLQAAQAQHGYLPPEQIEDIAQRCGVGVAEVYGVASFYNQFRFNPPGVHSIKVCTGTACHVKGASLVAGEFERQLGIGEGETTPDGAFDLKFVACVGCCAMAPVVIVDGETMGNADSAQAQHLVEKLRLDDGTVEAADSPFQGSGRNEFQFAAGDAGSNDDGSGSDASPSPVQGGERA